jgi:hypothetical protein
LKNERCNNFAGFVTTARIQNVPPLSSTKKYNGGGVTLNNMTVDHVASRHFKSVDFLFTG